uniref:Rhodanese domain-containing protein n=1 Tax=Oryza nivara TaxID=4536 RepID=A0A0E0HVQ1_ORYNI
MATLARVSLPSVLLTLRHGATTQGFAAARPAAVVAKRLLGSVRCGGAAEALGADMAVPRSVPVRVAHELQQAGHRYLDVSLIIVLDLCRTEGEFAGGHPVGAVNIPYMYKTGSGLTKNTHFLEKVSTTFGKEDEIIVGCQSGKRSLMAASELCSAGFTAVTDIAGGFSAWKENELPTNK